MSLEDSLRTLAEKIAILRTNLHRLELPVREPGQQPHESAAASPPDWDHVLVTALHDRASELSEKARACATLVNELQQEAEAGRGKRRLADLMGEVRASVNEVRTGLAGNLGLPKHIQELTDKAGEDSSWQPWVDDVLDAIGKSQQAVEQVRADLSDCWYEIDRLPDADEAVPPPADSRELTSAASPPEPPASAIPAPQTVVAPTSDTAAPSDQQTPDCAATSAAMCPTDPQDQCPDERRKEEVSKKPVIAKPEPRYGRLRVRVTSSGRGVSETLIKILGKDHADTERTNYNGDLEWAEVEAGSYTVRLELSQDDDYKLDDVLIDNHPTEDGETCTVEVAEGQCREVEYRLQSRGAEIRGRVVRRRGGCDDPIAGVKVEIASGKQVDYTTTDGKGVFRSCVEADRTYAVRMDPSIETGDKCGIPLAPESSTSLLVQTKAGQCHDVGDIAYVAVKGQVIVGAVSEGRRCDEQIPLDGLTFELRSAGCDGPGTRKSGDGDQYVTFANLEAGKYTLTLSGTPTSTKEPLQLACKPGNRATFLVTAGQTFDLRQYFRFERAAATVHGSVVDDESNDPLVGILVTLKYKGEENSTLEARTDRDGEFEFDVRPGPFRVLLASKTSTAGGHKWVLAPHAKGQLDGHVKLGETATLAPFKLIRDRHQIIATLKDESGSAIPDAALKIEDAEGNLVANVVTDKNGQVTYDVEREGTFYVVPVLEAGQPLRRYLAEVHSTATINMVAGGGSGGGQQAANAAGAIGQAFADVTTFPILTEAVDIPSTPSSSPVAQGGDASSWNRLVEGTVRDVLGWRPNAKDPRGVMAALTQSFAAQETDGFTEWVHKPRTYTVQMQADMGAVTGAQASLYSRAKNSLDAAQPLLDGLTPLIVDADLEDIDASRAIVRRQLEELLRELGTEGGPRPSRVDQAFETLSGPRIVQGKLAPISFDPDRVPGQLGILRDRFGMLRANVNTIDEEQNLTNFVILMDYVQTLRQSWESQRNFFDRLPHDGLQPYLGTQLVLVSRALSVVAESVTEVGFTMDSVFLGPAERATIALNLGVGESPLFVSELLNWIEHFAAEEAPRLIADSGKDGVEALKATLTTLARFVRRATQQVHVPAAFNTPRVRRAWVELADQIDQVSALIAQIKR